MNSLPQKKALPKRLLLLYRIIMLTIFKTINGHQDHENPKVQTGGHKLQ